MVIDLILDRKDGCAFDQNEFMEDITSYAEIWDFCKPMVEAINKKDNKALQKLLCDYIDCQWNDVQEWKDYVMSVSWV